MPLRLSSLAAASVLVLATGSQAIGFGQAPTSAVLGSALDFAVPMRLAPDESISAACISVEVMHGDQRWRGPDLALSLEGSGADRVLRVRGAQPLVEPVITVQVMVNCASSRVVRRFTAFVDPPDLDRVPTVATPAAAPATSTGALAQAVTGAASAPVSRPLPPVAARRELPPSVVRARKPARTAIDDGEAASKPPRRSVRSVTPAPEVRRVAADVLRLPPGASRLRLEDEAPEFFPSPAASGAPRPLLPFLQDVAQAAEAAASAADRVMALETSLQQLRAESLATREQISQMRGKVADAESINRIAPWLGAALAVMAALAAWFAWRLRQLQQAQEAQWWAATHEQGATPVAEPASDLAVSVAVPAVPPETAEVTASTRALTPASTPGEVLMARVAEVTPSVAEQTAVLDASVHDGLPESAPQRAVAIEELLDLEQQAEFFIVLGQDEAAIDLLMGHIRGTGGASPLPYLKLLELYRKNGDRDSYERTRTRFNHRFNAYAPDWDEDLSGGRMLEDYPAVLRRLQRLWQEPLDAMAELEALLFRRDDGELFHLPAYRELLFLYSVVRDVYDHADSGTGNVDVLLPLGHEEAAPSMPGEFVVGDHVSVVDTAPAARGQTEPMPLDLDLGGDSRPDDGLSFTLEPVPPRSPR